MLQWRPRLVVLAAVLVGIAVAAAGYIDCLIDGLTW
jgi:ABC-type cobalamin transport system permease subunit